MIGVFVSFTFPDSFDSAAVRAVARQARGKFEGMPALRSKAFTLDETERRAVNFYIWEDEAAARGFFNTELVSRVAQLYGAKPTITFVEVAELVDNAR